MNENQRVVKNRLRVLEHAKEIGNIRKTCRYFGIPRSSFYRWKTAYDRNGELGLVNKPPVAKSHPNRKMQSVGRRAVSDPRKDGTSVQSSYN